MSTQLTRDLYRVYGVDSINPRRLLGGDAGADGNRNCQRRAAHVSVPKLVVTAEVPDVDPRLSRCEELGCDEVARWTVTFGERRNRCCDDHAPLVFRYALDANTRAGNFYPVEAAPIGLPAWVTA
jgi:hypothetical protein